MLGPFLENGVPLNSVGLEIRREQGYVLYVHDALGNLNIVPGDSCISGLCSDLHAALGYYPVDEYLGGILVLGALDDGGRLGPPARTVLGIDQFDMGVVYFKIPVPVAGVYAHNCFPVDNHIGRIAASSREEGDLGNQLVQISPSGFLSLGLQNGANNIVSRSG